jgi:hypothetical protein
MVSGEAGLGADAHEVDRDAGVGTDEVLRARRRLGALQHDLQRVARRLVAIALQGTAQGRVRVLGNAAQRAVVEPGADVAQGVVGDGHGGLSS